MQMIGQNHDRVEAAGSLLPGGDTAAWALPDWVIRSATLVAAMLFLTPMSFLISTTRNCRVLSDWLALAFGLVLGPLLAAWQVGLDLLWTGIVGGSVAYGIYRLREARR